MYALKEDLITAKHYDKQFKIDAVQYYHDHKELGLIGCASNLGISHQSLSRWQKKLRETGDIESRGSGNYACSSEIGDYEEILIVSTSFLPSALIPRMTYAASFRITPLSRTE